MPPKSFRLCLAALALLATVGVAAGPAAAGPVVVNGSFESVGGAGASCSTPTCLVDNTDLPGWTTTSGWSFVVAPGGASGYIQGNFPATSPDGGNFLLQDGSYLNGTLTQTLTGLVVGRAYTINFLQAAGQQVGFSGNDYDHWQVSLGDQSKSSTTMTVTNGVFVGWVAQAITFVADATTAVLGFQAVGLDQTTGQLSPGEPPFLGLDGVSIAAVPEPASYAILGAGLVGLGLLRRRSRKV